LYQTGSVCTFKKEGTLMKMHGELHATVSSNYRIWIGFHLLYFLYVFCGIKQIT